MVSPLVAYVLCGGPLDGDGGRMHPLFEGDYQFDTAGRRHVYRRTPDRTPDRRVIFRYAYSETIGEDCRGR